MILKRPVKQLQAAFLWALFVWGFVLKYIVMSLSK